MPPSLRSQYCVGFIVFSFICLVDLQHVANKTAKTTKDKNLSRPNSLQHLTWTIWSFATSPLQWMSSLSIHNQSTNQGKKDRRCRDEHGEIARYGSNYALESNKALDVQQAVPVHRLKRSQEWSTTTKKVAWFSRSAAILICKMHYFSQCSILFKGHQLLLQKVQYFLKTRSILSKHAVLLQKMQHSLNRAVILKMFSNLSMSSIATKDMACFKELHSLIGNVSCTKCMCLS